MTLFKKLTLWLLIAVTLLACTGCGNSVPDIMDDGADRFAAGKPEENYYLKNSGVLLDELIQNYSGSYQLPVSVQVDDDDIPTTDPTDPTDSTDPDADPDATDPTEETVPAVAVVSSWEDFLDVFYDAYCETAPSVTFEVGGGFNPDLNTDLNKSFTELQREDPIQASCVKQWSWYTVGNTYYIDITYSIDPAELITMKDATEGLVEQAVSRIDTTGMSDYEIVCAVNDYLCDTVYYPPTEPYAPVTHTAYGALENGVAVCEGYACAAKLMLNELGIRCDIEVGDCIGGGGHAWNLVDLDGVWYQMDVTWNDGGGSRTDYLLVDDAYMRKSRNWDATLYPVCPAMYVH